MNLLKQLITTLVAVLTLDTKGLGQNLMLNWNEVGVFHIYCHICHHYWSVIQLSNSPCSVLHNVICVALWLSCVTKFVTHSFPPQMQVPGTQFVCAGQTCLCSWLLWWGGTAQQLTHLSLRRWGDAGEHLQVHRYFARFVCAWVRACVKVSKSDKINYTGLGCIIVSIIIYYG